MDQHVLVLRKKHYPMVFRGTIHPVTGALINTVAETENLNFRYITRRPVGICAKFIAINVENNHIKEVVIQGRCCGASEALCNLLVGKTPKRAIKLLEGIKCLSKTSSCADQIAKALQQ